MCLISPTFSAFYIVAMNSSQTPCARCYNGGCCFYASCKKPCCGGVGTWCFPLRVLYSTVTTWWIPRWCLFFYIIFTLVAALAYTKIVPEGGLYGLEENITVRMLLWHILSILASFFACFYCHEWTVLSNDIFSYHGSNIFTSKDVMSASGEKKVGPSSSDLSKNDGTFFELDDISSSQTNAYEFRGSFSEI